MSRIAPLAPMLVFARLLFACGSPVQPASSPGETDPNSELHIWDVASG